MLLVATCLLGLTLMAGLGLAVRLSLVPVGRRLWPAIAHGLLGAAGFVVLLLGLRGPARGVAMGAGSFGTIAAAMLALALLAALAIIAAQVRRRPPATLVVAVHATLAIAGFVVLAAYVSMPS